MYSYLIHKQSKNLCGPASLKTIFDYLLLVKTEEEWARLSNASAEEGTEAHALIEAIHSVGYSAQYKNNITLAELRSALLSNNHIIVNYWQHGVGHYSPVADITHENIIIADVESGEQIIMSTSDFERNWFDFDNYPPNSPEDLILRAAIIIDQLSTSPQNHPE